MQKRIIEKKIEVEVKRIRAGTGTMAPAFDKKCELCQDTGWYGDNGPGIRGNREYQPCECRM